MNEETDRKAGNEGPGSPAPTPGEAAEAPPAAAPKAEGSAPEGVALTQRIKYDDFAKVELRTAKIKLAERVEGADRLLRLELEVGDEERQIVAGIAEHYAPEDLAGKAIVMVYNLKPAKIRGVKSNGMLLAASTDDALKLVTIDGEFPSGVRVR